MRSARLETVPSHCSTTSGGDQGRALLLVFQGLGHGAGDTHRALFGRARAKALGIDPKIYAETLKAEREAGMKAQSQEFLAEGGKLYVDAAE